MAIREICKWPEDVLKLKALEVKNIDFGTVTLVEDMVETMYQENGVGLAAPQVAVSERVIVVDASPKTGYGGLITMINPVIAEKEGRVVDSEACLSVPEVTVDVPRFERILVKGVDIKGKDVEIEAEGFLARVFQHEIDHLDGRVILAFASSLKRAIYLKKARKGKI
ncbi:MAG TPA: peptide deformylase [Desulfomonilia bacterium]